MPRDFTVVVERDEDGNYVASVPALAGEPGPRFLPSAWKRRAAPIKTPALSRRRRRLQP